jgi:hypothetical protein
MSRDRKIRIGLYFAIGNTILIIISLVISKINFITDFYVTDVGDTLDDINYLIFIGLSYSLLLLILSLVGRFLYLKFKK